MRNNTTALAAHELTSACDAWGRTPSTGGGTLGLGLWMQHWAERHGRKGFSAHEYGAVLIQVRDAIGDAVDYATFYGDAALDELSPILGSGEYVIPAGVDVESCRSCGANIVWTKTAAGKAVPLSLALVEERNGQRVTKTHFSDCVDAKEWSRRK